MIHGAVWYLPHEAAGVFQGGVTGAMAVSRGQEAAVARPGIESNVHSQDDAFD